MSSCQSVFANLGQRATATRLFLTEGGLKGHELAIDKKWLTAGGRDSPAGSPRKRVPLMWLHSNGRGGFGFLLHASYAKRVYLKTPKDAR